MPEETCSHLLLKAQDQQLDAEQNQLPCGSTGTSSDNCQETGNLLGRKTSNENSGFLSNALPCNKQTLAILYDYKKLTFLPALYSLVYCYKMLGFTYTGVYFCIKVLFTSWILRATWSKITWQSLCSGDTDKMASSRLLCCLLVLFVALVAVEAWSGWVKWHFFNCYTVWRVRFYTWSRCSGDTDTMVSSRFLCYLLALFLALVVDSVKSEKMGSNIKRLACRGRSGQVAFFYRVQVCSFHFWWLPRFAMPILCCKLNIQNGYRKHSKSQKHS